MQTWDNSTRGDNYVLALLGIPNSNPKGNTMYLTTGDILAVIIALVVSVTLVITTALANARLTTSRDEWRKAYYAVKGRD